MAPISNTPAADNRTLKRSFTAVAVSTPPSPERTAVTKTAGLLARRLRQRADGLSRQVFQRERSISPSMSSSSPPHMMCGSPLPSFKFVDTESTSRERTATHPTVETQAPKSSEIVFDAENARQNLQSHDQIRKEGTPSHGHTSIHSHQHRESTSTTDSDSTDSSPTTTISTVDSSSLSDPSPNSSPESPTTVLPISSFPGLSFGLDSFQNLKMIDALSPRLPASDDRPMTSPNSRKPKNPKSLALNLSPTSDTFQISEPSSPSFIKPPTLKGRKKPSLLSLNTGAANNLLSVEAPTSPGKLSMLQRRSLKHSISTPQMLSTPGFGPAGGMIFKAPLASFRFKETNTFTITEDVHEPQPGVQMATRVPGASVGGDSFDRPHSGEDAKSPSYPEGPILMYEPSVHLYLEPKIEEAMKFDVIINVAKEVQNPFKVVEDQESRKLSQSTCSDSFAPVNCNCTPPGSAATILSYRTAFEVQPSSVESSPTTPKPNTELKIPEYFHVPWDHNTDVKDELWDLCQLIETRVKQGKKVLVHCQQGASRSATLIIAYGMYINQNLGPNEAYSLAQSKSRWVNPNMSLLFSLNDFKKVIEKKKAEKNNTVRKTTVKPRPKSSVDAAESPSTRRNSTPNNLLRDNHMSIIKSEVVPEPASAIEMDSAITRLGAFDFGFSDIYTKPENSWETLLPPRINGINNNSMHLRAGTDSPSTPVLFSPRNFEFPRAAFFEAPTKRNSLALPDVDPRSPPIKGEVPITRSIDDFL